MTESSPAARLDAAFLERACTAHQGFSAILRPGASPEFTLVVAEGCATARVEGQGGVVAAHLASSRPAERARRLIDSHGSSPRGFVPARETQGSFLLWHPGRRELVVGRDRTACYHLYLGWREGALYVSTDVRPFVGTLCTERDEVGTDLYLAYSSPVAPFPIYRGLQPVLPGRWFSLDPAELLTEPDLSRGGVFWQIEPVEPPETYERAVELYGELFLDSVREHLDTGAAGVMLSGGSDSACVVGALDKLGAKDVVAGHMRVPGHQDAELGLVEALRDRFGFRLELVEPLAFEGDWFEHAQEAIRWHVSGSYDTFPAYRLLGQRLAELLPAGATVYNGEMCLLDQGFSDAADRTRGLKRWLYRGGGRRLARAPAIAPGAVRRVAQRLGRHTGYPAAIAETGLELLHAIGRPAWWFAGMKLGGRGFPGAPRAMYRFSQDQPWDTPRAAVEGFFAEFAQALTTQRWPQTVATLANAWYSESSNFTMPLYALGKADLSLCFPFSSPQLMDLAASLPTEWSRDKRIQKDMSEQVLGLPHDVAWFQKDHTHATSYATLVYDPATRARILAAIAAHDYGPIQAGVTRRLEQLETGDRQYSVVMFVLWCLSLYDEQLQEGVKPTQ